VAVQPGLGQSGPGAVGRDPLGFGLVGCGAIAATYAAAFAGLAEARLVAVTDLDGSLAERFAAEHGVVDASGLDNMLAMPEVEAVCVLVPSGLHGKVGLAVAEGGKHVVVEKPIEISLPAARRLIDGAAARGVSLSVISQQRYNPGVQRARALLASGRLGRLVEVWASVPWHRTQAYYDSGSWRGTWALDGGGALMNQAVHYADLVCWLCGAPEVLSATCATVAHDIEVEDLALALLRFESGALGMLEASTVSFPGFPTTLRVSGTAGTIVLENGELVSAQVQDGDESLTEGDVSALGFPGGHRAQLADITSAIVEGRPQSVSGEDGYRALKLVLDVYEAAGWGPPAR
jgi:predicted dehydrogenase